MFGAKRLPLTVIRITVVALTPNIKLASILPARSIWIDSALNLRDPLLMIKDQLRHSNHSADDNCSDRYQENP
jgi:hypothetical protein